MRLEIADGELRGLSDLKLQFRYPITAISGKNGTGKSTVLACVACGFHNTSSGFRSLNRRIPYYTFSDFFIQSAEEEPLAFVSIGYQILHDNWRKTKSLRSGVGLAWQLDGDQVQRKAEHVNVFISALENVKDRDASRDWIENRLTFLPSEARPESWVVKTVATDISDNLADDFGVSKDELKTHIDAAAAAKDHTEMHLLGAKLNLPASTIRTRLIRAALRRSPDDVSRIVEFVKRFLS